MPHTPEHFRFPEIDDPLRNGIVPSPDVPDPEKALENALEVLNALIGQREAFLKDEGQQITISPSIEPSDGAFRLSDDVLGNLIQNFLAPDEREPFSRRTLGKQYTLNDVDRLRSEMGLRIIRRVQEAGFRMSEDDNRDLSNFLIFNMLNPERSPTGISGTRGLAPELLTIAESQLQIEEDNIRSFPEAVLNGQRLSAIGRAHVAAGEMTAQEFQAVLDPELGIDPVTNNTTEEQQPAFAFLSKMNQIDPDTGQTNFERVFANAASNAETSSLNNAVEQDIRRVSEEDRLTGQTPYSFKETPGQLQTQAQELNTALRFAPDESGKIPNLKELVDETLGNQSLLPKGDAREAATQVNRIIADALTREVQTAIDNGALFQTDEQRAALGVLPTKRIGELIGFGVPQMLFDQEISTIQQEQLPSIDSSSRAFSAFDEFLFDQGLSKDDVSEDFRVDSARFIKEQGQFSPAVADAIGRVLPDAISAQINANVLGAAREENLRLQGDPNLRRSRIFGEVDRLSSQQFRTAFPAGRLPASISGQPFITQPEQAQAFQSAQALAVREIDRQALEALQGNGLFTGVERLAREATEGFQRTILDPVRFGAVPPGFAQADGSTQPIDDEAFVPGEGAANPAPGLSSFTFGGPPTVGSGAVRRGGAFRNVGKNLVNELGPRTPNVEQEDLERFISELSGGDTLLQRFLFRNIGETLKGIQSDIDIENQRTVKRAQGRGRASRTFGPVTRSFRPRRLELSDLESKRLDLGESFKRSPEFTDREQARRLKRLRQPRARVA